MNIRESALLRAVFNNEISEQTLARLGYRLDGLHCVARHKRVMPAWAECSRMRTIDGRHHPQQGDNWTGYRASTVPVFVRIGLCTQYRHTRKDGVQYLKVLTSKGWRTSYASPEDAVRVARQLSIASESAALSRWLEERAVFNH